MNETQAIALFRKSCNGMVIKLHGNAYQSLLPDTIWIHKGEVKFLEFKIIDKTKIPKSSFRLGQHAMLLQMLKHGASCWYCVYSRDKAGFFMLDPRSVNPEESFEVPSDEPIFRGFRCDGNMEYERKPPAPVMAGGNHA